MNGFLVNCDAGIEQYSLWNDADGKAQAENEEQSGKMTKTAGPRSRRHNDADEARNKWSSDCS